jgi:hypothetical protein
VAFVSKNFHGRKSSAQTKQKIDGSQDTDDREKKAQAFAADDSGFHFRCRDAQLQTLSPTSGGQA